MKKLKYAVWDIKNKTFLNLGDGEYGLDTEGNLIKYSVRENYLETEEVPNVEIVILEYKP